MYYHPEDAEADSASFLSDPGEWIHDHFYRPPDEEPGDEHYDDRPQFIAHSPCRVLSVPWKEDFQGPADR